MDAEKLLGNIILYSTPDLITFLKNNNNGLRLCFLQATFSIDEGRCFAKTISTLAQKQMQREQIQTDEIQALYTHLAFYFKKFNKYQYVDTCTTHIIDNIFKKRLSAWLHHKRYNKHIQHISEFENYLKKLSLAIQDNENEYTYEILSDLNDYRTTTLLKISPELGRQFSELFFDPNFIDRFPILLQLNNDVLQLLPDLEIEEEKDIEYMPSNQILYIFNQKFMDHVKQNKLFGYTMVEVTENIIGKGQTNFDKGYESLSAENVVKLYCYCNMRMHYFSSLRICK